VQLPLEGTGDLVRRPDHEVVEPVVAEHLEGDVRRPAEVAVGGGRRLARHLVACQLAPVVVVAGQPVDQLGLLDQLVELEQEQPGPLAVGQQQGEPLPAREHRLQLADVGRVVDHDPVPHGHAQLDHRPQPVGRAGEGGEAAHVGPAQAAPHVFGDASEILLDRLLGRLRHPVRPGAGPRLADEGVEVRLEVAGAHEPPPVHVEVQGRDGRVGSGEPGQLPDDAPVDRPHSSRMLASRHSPGVRR
jgi:hypothetical protein